MRKWLKIAFFGMLFVYSFLQMSYIAMTSSTADRDLFPNLFMVNQIMDDLNPLRIKMMQYFNWNRAGTIFFQDDISVSVCFFFCFCL